MSDRPPTIRETFVAAYPQYVAGILTDRGVEVDSTIADGIVIGTGVLDGLLASFEAKPPGFVTRSPLELFREALRPMDRALEVAGVDPPVIDVIQLDVLPWDRYALSPGSPQQLGPAAHEAHLRWGIAKVKAHVERPTAGLRCGEDDAPRILEQLDGLGYRVIRLPAEEDVFVAVLDIDGEAVDGIISQLTTTGTHVIVFGDDPNDMQQIRFKALGAVAVLPKQAIFDDLANHIPIIV
jgi:hypothetical protein